MCSRAIIDDRDYPTQGELRNRLGLSGLPLTGGDRYRRQENDRVCLCGVDMDKLAQLLGCKIEYDCLDYYIRLDDESEVGVVRLE